MGLEAAAWWGPADAGQGVHGVPARGAQLSLRDRVRFGPLPIPITMWLQQLPALLGLHCVRDAHKAFWVG